MGQSTLFIRAELGIGTTTQFRKIHQQHFMIDLSSGRVLMRNKPHFWFVYIVRHQLFVSILKKDCAGWVYRRGLALISVLGGWMETKLAT
mmetsp:Transcript_54130/g.65140  ORF Transcript_54130/g.65140 Transcript_54130/m.65140 type:complete len:90 (+) Transcript_54130:387-656(+)